MEKEKNILSFLSIRNFIPLFIFVIFIFAGLLLFGDVSKIGPIFFNFEWLFLPLIVILTSINYFLRFIKWDFLLGKIGVNITKKVSFIIFVSGLSMSITPGKTGEFFKSYLIKKINNQKISKTMPVILVERVTDIISLVILSSAGVVIFEYGLTALIIIISLILAFLTAIQNRRFSGWLITKMKKFSAISKFSDSIEEFYKSSYKLLSPRNLIPATLIGVLSWSTECIALFFVFKGLNVNQSILFSSFTFSFSSVVGAISMFPGGLGIAEGSMTGIMITLGNMMKEFAVTSTLIIRFATLWFGVILGVVTLILNNEKFGLNLTLGKHSLRGTKHE